jgi:CspA family cold shock protein
MFERRPGFFRTEEGQPTGRRVEATVKWFNATKGFGFVTMTDGTADAFLPIATLRRAGYDDVREGAAITCEIGTGAKGPLVVSVINVERSTNAPTAAPSASRRPPEPGARAPQTLEGTVKWYDPDRGFGFTRGGRQGHLRPRHGAAPQRRRRARAGPARARRGGRGPAGARSRARGYHLTQNSPLKTREGTVRERAR